jgi:AcrR family transcriptional regulator
VPTPRRGPRPRLDLDAILDAGIAIADASGLAAVSTRAVAARFDLTAMALYPYVGTKENLLALMEDHASAMPSWPDPSSLSGALEAWALALYSLYLEHPWLTERPWAQASQGPNEQDWLERCCGSFCYGRSRRLAAVGRHHAVRDGARVRRDDRGLPASDAGGDGRLARQALATRELIPDLCDRYPLSTGLEPITAEWQDAPRAGLLGAVRLLASALVSTAG